MMDSDMQSQFSMPVSGISRRSDFTTITLNVTGNGKNQKLPGEKSLKAKAEERMQRARLMEIERYLGQIKKSDDLSYSENAQQISAPTTDDQDKKLIDEDTLLRLIDECKDEEARLSVMNHSDSIMMETKSQIVKQTEMTAIELDQFDSVVRRLREAESLATQQSQVVATLKKDMENTD